MVVDEVLTPRDLAGDTPVAAVADPGPPWGERATCHNMANALAAMAAADRLGVGPDSLSVRTGGTPTIDGDPGAPNLFELDGRTFVVDFAHDPAEVTTITQTVARMPAEHRLVLGQRDEVLAMLGDRDDEAAVP